MKAQTGGARSALILAALFVAVRLIVLALGQRFDADNLTSWMQIADLALLREHLWRTRYHGDGTRKSPQPKENYVRPPNMRQRRAKHKSAVASSGVAA